MFFPFPFDPYRDPYGTAERKESDRTGEQVNHRLGSLFLCHCGDMGIGVQREPGGIVSQHPGDRFDVHTVLERQRCECVSQIMKAHLRQSRLFQHPVEHIQNTVQGDRAARGRREHIVAVRLTFLS